MKIEKFIEGPFGFCLFIFAMAGLATAFLLGTCYLSSFLAVAVFKLSSIFRISGVCFILFVCWVASRTDNPLFFDEEDEEDGGVVGAVIGSLGVLVLAFLLSLPLTLIYRSLQLL